MRIRLLGSGTSTGVPRIGDDWGDCDPAEPRNRRSRVSAIIETDEGKRILIDTSTDLRSQLLAANIGSVDAVVWTHDHADHCHGIDDLRVMRYGRNGPLPAFASEPTVRRLRQRFGYVFAGRGGYPTISELNTFDRVRLIAGVGISTCEMPHGEMSSTGLRFDQGGKSIVYATDFCQITSEMTALFSDADILVSDCLRMEPHPTHAHLEMALELQHRCAAKLLILTHLDKSMDYRTVQSLVPENVLVGYDGLEIAA